jgi:hypothetical protein
MVYTQMRETIAKAGPAKPIRYQPWNSMTTQGKVSARSAATIAEKELAPCGTEANPSKAATAEVHVPEHTEGRLDLPYVVNGVVFEEILHPPRAKRPLECWRDKL